MSDQSENISCIVEEACNQKQALKIVAGNSKHFYGRNIQAKTLSLQRHFGIEEYEPSELYITARSGTSLHEINQTIAEQNQILPCEPALFGNQATIGGLIASGLSGPRRASAGSVRDCILGTKIINGNGQPLSFGGRVMKNVAGFDVSRLMCGALGTLGVITSVTMRLLPMPEEEQTLVLNIDCAAAIKLMNQWASTPAPISATFYDGENLFFRLSSSHTAIEACKKKIGGDVIENSGDFWNSIKEQSHAFFQHDDPLWRLSVPPSTHDLNLPGKNAMEWNGALRWYCGDCAESAIRSKASEIGGQASLYKGTNVESIFHPLSETSMKIHKNLKHVLDPVGILNPGKMFAEL